MIIVTSSFLHEKKTPAFSNFSALKFVFEQLRFRSRISVDGSPNRRNKAAFSKFFDVVLMFPGCKALAKRTGK